LGLVALEVLLWVLITVTTLARVNGVIHRQLSSNLLHSRQLWDSSFDFWWAFATCAVIDSLRSTTSTSARTSGLSRGLGLGRRPK
jgi:hypothetical protein